MADNDFDQLLQAASQGSQQQADWAYQTLLDDATRGTDNDGRFTELLAAAGGEAPKRGWQALGQYFWEGMQRNARNLQAVPAGLRAQYHELRGNAAEATLAAQEAAQIEAQAPQQTWSLQDVTNPEDFAYWLMERFGENSLTLLTSFAGGGSGMIIGGLGARALGGSLAARRAAMTAGLLAGGFATSTAIETAATGSEQFQVTGSVRPELSLPAGVAKGLLELWVPNRVLNALSTPGRQLGKTWTGATLRTGAQEAITESLQESIDIAARMYSDPEYSFFGKGPELSMGPGAWRLLEAATAGGLIGTAVGGVSAAVEQRQERQRETGGLEPGQEQLVREAPPPTPAAEVPAAEVPGVSSLSMLRPQPKGFVEVYHGTQQGYEQINVDFAQANEPGTFFTTDLAEADQYTKGMGHGQQIGYAEGSNIRREVLDTSNLKEVAAGPGLRAQAQQAREEGFSGIYVNLPARKAGGKPRTQYVIWDQGVIQPAGKPQGLLHQASVRVQVPTAPAAPAPAPVPETPAEENQPGPVTTLRSLVLRQPTADQGPVESTIPIPEQDLLHVTPQLRSDMHPDVAEVYADFVDANTPRYVLVEPDGSLSNRILTDTDLEFESIDLPQNQKPQVMLVDQGSLVPAGITAMVEDLPDVMDRRVWYLPGTTEAEQVGLNHDYVQLRSDINNRRHELLGTDLANRQLLLEGFRLRYDALLAQGLRVIPARGASFLYQGGASLKAQEVAHPSTTGRAKHWAFLGTDGVLRIGGWAEASPFLSNQFSMSVLGAVPVTLDYNRFAPGEISALPVRIQPSATNPTGMQYFWWNGVPLQEKESIYVAQERFRNELEDLVPGPGQIWDKKRLEKFRGYMKQGIYADPRKYSYTNAVVTREPLTLEKLVPGINYETAGKGAYTTETNPRRFSAPADKWGPGSRITEQINPDEQKYADKLLPALRGMLPVFDTIVREMGVEGGYTIAVRSDPNLAFMANAQADIDANTIVFPLGDTNSWANTDSKYYEAKVWSTLMHELGHMLTYRYYAKLPGEMQQQIAYAYNKALLVERSNPAKFPGRIATLYTDVEVQDQSLDYYSTFVEWLAEQFRRFAASDVTIRSELDRVFKQGADQLERFYAEVEKHNPQGYVDLLNPDFFFSGFMQYLRDFGKAKIQLKQLERQQALYSVDEDIYGSPVATRTMESVLAALKTVQHMMPVGHPFHLLFSDKLDEKLAAVDEGALARTVFGVQGKTLIELAVGSLERADQSVLQEVFAHELMHTYSALGIITRQELNLLYTSAIADGKGLSPGYKYSLREKVKKEGSVKGWNELKIEQEYQNALREETVAYYTSHFIKTGLARPEAKPLLQRIIEVLKAVHNFMRGLGFHTRESILEAFFRGEMVSRAARRQEDAQVVQRYMRTLFTPELINWDEVKQVDERYEVRVEKNRDAEGKLYFATYQYVDKVTGKIVGQQQIEIAPMRGFNVHMMHSDAPGMTMKWLEFVGRDLNLPLLAPQIFTLTGMRAASRVYPILQKYYVKMRLDVVDYYYSPKAIKQQVDKWQRIVDAVQARVDAGEKIDTKTFVAAKAKLRLAKLAYAKIPEDIWTENRHLLDQLFTLERNHSRDEVQGSLVREGARVAEAQLGSILGQAAPAGARTDSFQQAAARQAQQERRSAAEKLGLEYEAAAAGQPSTLSIRRILAWADRTGGTTHPSYRRHLARAPHDVIVSQEADRIGYFSRVYWGIRQLIWRNEHITGLLTYGQRVEQYSTVITSWHREADDIARVWEQRLRNPRQREQFNQLMYWLAEMNYRSAAEEAAGVVRHPTQGELNAELTRRGLNTPVITDSANGLLWQLYQPPWQVGVTPRNSIFARFLDAVEAVSVNNIRLTISDPALQAKAINEVVAEMNELRAKPYYPVTRFGQHSITVRDPSSNNEVVWFSTYDNHLDRDRALAQVAADPRFVGDHIFKGRVPEEFIEFLGLPGPLIREIRNNMPNLTATQIAWLEQLERQNLPDKQFRARWKPRTGTPGYSMDAFRSFAHYFMHGSRYLARMQYRNPMLQAIREVEATLPVLPNSSKRTMIIDKMKSHYNYLMEGGRDWAKFKALVALLQLGFSPAAAFMNLTQTPMVSMPWLMGVFGNVAAQPQLLKSIASARGLRKGTVVSKLGNYQLARQEMIRQARIDIGQAAELGAYAEGNNLLGLLSGTARQKMFRKFSTWGMWMFQRAEQANREIMMHAVWELGHKQFKTNKRIKDIEQHYDTEIRELQARLGMAYEDAVVFVLAKEALDQTQGLYAPYARPTFMQHPVAGTMLIFYQFVQMMTYAFRYNPGVVQLWLMMAMVYGVAGLPGAEEFGELMRLLARKLFGKDYDLKMEARKMVREVTRGTVFDEVGPDLFLHGVSRFGFGLGLLPDGYAIGQFDASANGSMGKLVPGLYEWLHGLNTGADASRVVADISQRVAGAGFGWFFNLAQFGSESPGTVDGHRWEQMLPRTLRAMAAGYRYSPPGVLPDLAAARQQLPLILGAAVPPLKPQGGATLASGAQVVRFNATDPEDVAAVVGQFLGFRPTQVSMTMERRRELVEARQIWMARRTALMVQMSAAMLSGQQEVLETVQKAITNFNEEVAAEGVPELGLRPEQIRQSMRARERGRMLDEAFIPNQRLFRPTAERLKDLFPGVRVQNVK